MSENGGDKGTISIVLAGLLALLGTVVGGVVEGYLDTSLAKDKFQADLVMLALAGDDAEERFETFRFLVDSGLLDDADLADGIAVYLEDDPAERKALPHVRAQGRTFSTGVAIASTPETQGFTDFDVYVCDEFQSSPAAGDQALRVVQGLAQMGQVGQVRRKVWSFDEEIPPAELHDKVTIVVDDGHPEKGELDRVRRALDADDVLPDITVRPNTGRPTGWLISIVVCPTS